MPLVGNFRFRAVRKSKSTSLEFAELSRRLKSLNMSRYTPYSHASENITTFPTRTVQNESELLIATSIETTKS